MIENKTYKDTNLTYHTAIIEDSLKYPSTRSKPNRNRFVPTSRIDGVVKLRLSIREIPEILSTTSTIYWIIILLTG